MWCRCYGTTCDQQVAGSTLATADLYNAEEQFEQSPTRVPLQAV